VWDLETGRQVGPDLTGHTEPVRAATVTPDGQEIVTGGDDGTARVWDRATGQQRVSMSGHTASKRLGSAQQIVQRFMVLLEVEVPEDRHTARHTVLGPAHPPSPGLSHGTIVS
jgi:hypothetical protein